MSVLVRLRPHVAHDGSIGANLTVHATGTCSLREAQIISACLARVSIPVLHSAAAIKTLCDIAAEQVSQQSESVSATNYLLKVLLEKRYALRTSSATYVTVL